MTDELFSYSDFHNIGFFINPDIQDSQFKAMKRREQLLQGAYYYANADRDEECRNKSAEIFGRGTIPLTDKENSAFFLGDAVLKESGYLGSPFEYWVANNKDLPPEVQTESDARIYIGNQIIDTARQQYDQRKEYEKKVDEVRDALPRYIAQTVRMPGVYTGQLADKQAASVLSDIGMWDKLEPSVQRARTAWIRSQHMLASVDAMQEAGREELADLADILSNEKGEIDEVAVEAYFAAVRELAMEKQSKDSQFWATFADSFQNFLSRTDDEQTKDAYLMAEDVLSDLAIDDIAMKQDLFNPEAAARRARLYSPKVGKMIGILQNAMDTAMEPSKEAGIWATLATDLGKLSGDAVVPMIGAIAASAFTKGAGIGVIGQAAAGWAGGFAVSHDSIINQSVAQAYLEGVENPEEYGIYSGLGQSAAENIAGVGTSGFYAFKFINKGLAKAGAKFGTSRVLSNAYARATLAWAGTTVTEGTMELAEEELGSWMGAQLNALARANGVQMSEQKHEWGKTIAQMPEHQIAAMYVFAGVLGLGGGVANYTKAQQISMDVDKLKASGFSDKTAREVVADGIVHAQKVEEVKNSDLSEEKKDVELKKLSDERLAYLGKMFNKDVVMASNSDMQKRSQEENAEFTYRAMLAMAIRNGLDEKAMEDLGLMAKREAGGKYLVSYEEPAEGENAKPKLVQKEWTRDQLTGFLLFQRGTAFHNHIREIQSALSAVKFAQSVASVEELGFKLANLKDIPLSEIDALRYHNAITPELFAAFAEHETAKISADMSAGMSRAQAEAQPSAILPGVSRGQVLGMEQKSKERIEQAKQTGEIKTGQNVYFPAINISRLDGSTLVAYFSGKVSLPKMLEEMFEGQLKQQARNNPDLYNQLGKALQNIQRKLGVKLLPKNKTEFSKDDIIEGYSHLAVAEMLSNAEYINLPTAEKAVVMDVLRNVETAAHYKLIADAWQTYKNSDAGKDYLTKGGKDIMDIMRDAGFTFGKHFSASQVSAEERAKLLEERNFMFDVEEEAKQLEEQANAEEELSNVNAKEAEEPVVIPASESVTGEEIVEQPEPNYTIEPTAEEQSPVQLAYQNILNGTAKVNDYALYLYYNPMSDAEATERGIRTLNQQGEESALYTKGKLLSVFRDGKYSHADGQARDVLTGEVPVNRITHSPEVPQFKTNKAGRKADEKGVVYSLPGDYRMHDPIHLWHRVDGSLVVISGRHRLQKAIEAGVEYIPATVFPEVTGRDAAWARMHDFEQNVLDNQASVADTALYVRGMNPKGRQLTEEETKQFTRQGSNSEAGSYIGLHGSTELINYLAAGPISPDYAHQIAQLAPGNADVQQVAIDALMQDKGITEAKQAAEIYRDNQALKESDIFQSLGNSQRQEAFMRFLSQYAANKIRTLGNAKRVHKGAKTDKSIREHEAAGVKFEDAAKNRAKLQELSAEQEAWKNVGTHPELIEEAKAEFDKTAEGAQQYLDFGNFSIAALSPGDRFPGNPLAVRMSNYLRREAKRFARVLGDKTPHDTAVNAINSARSVIGMLDKYVHTNAIPISRDARNRLNLLQHIIEKYAQIIEKGSKRSFNQISKEEQGVLDAIVEKMGAALETGQTKETAKARYKELIRMAAKGRVWQLLSEMMTEAGNLVDIYLKNELLQKLKRVTNTVKLKRSKSGKLKGKMGAADYRRMDTVVQLMGMSARAKDNDLGQIEGARLLLQSRKNELPDTGVNELIDEIRNELKAQGKEATMEDVYMVLNNREADLLTFADIESMDYDQTRKAANALATLIYAGRAEWELAQQEKYEKIKTFLDFFYKHTSALAGTAQENDKAKRGSIGNIFNSSMSDAQLLFALSGHEALRPVMDELRRNLATAQDARNLHLKSITNQIYATYARLIGMRPQTEAGYTDKQLREASNKLSLELEKWNKTDDPDIVRKWMKDGELLEQKMELTRLQALDLILTYRQPHYAENAAAHGYTEGVLNKLEDFCGPRLMAMGAAFKYSIQNDGTAAVYEEREGIPMYNDPTYWPGSININTINITSEEPIVNPFNIAGSYHFLKERVKHTHEAKYQNAFEKWKYAISERANYIYLSPITGTLNRMLAHNEFANRLKSLIGADLFAQLRLMLNTVDGSTWQETSLRDEANNWAARMLRATAPAVLALNPQTYMRQLSAINNYAMMPNVDWNKLPAIITLIRQDKAKMTLGQIVQLDSFKARARDNAALNDMIGLGPNAKFSRFNQLAKAGMNHIDVIDVWSNAVSACLYYNMLYEQLEAKNKDMADPLSEEEIRQYCEQSVSEMLRLVAQPLEKANKSAMYWKTGNTWYGSLFLYMSSEMINKAGMLRATYLKNKAEGMSWAKNMSWLVGRMGLGLGGMTFLVEAAIFMLFAGDLPDDEKEWLTAGIALAVYSSFGQYFSRIPFVGSVADYYLSPYGKYTTNKNVAQAPALNIDKTSAKLLKMLTDNKKYSGAEWQSAYTRFVRDLTAVAGLASGIKPEVQWISTTSAVLQSLSAAMNSVYPVSRAVQSDSWWRDVTPDGYSPKKTKKREKSSLEEGLDALFGVEKDKKKGKKKDRTSKKD